ncbi:MAG: type 4a pilus biogenesis protein PilO [Vicinamibacteria bacterium]|nr:type 4a pilus biogenesis protein PilO [Vicinamibacteria bacterium]
MGLGLNKLPWKAQVGVFLAIAVAALGGFYWYYVQDVRARHATEQAKLDRLRADITKGSATARQLPQFRQEVGELEARLANLRAVLPEEKDVGDLLRRIQTLATQSNLQIKGFKPAPIVTRQMHAEWPINLELDGTYHNLGVFFDRVGKFSRIINVGAVKIKAKEKPAPGSTIGVLCTATTFVLIEPKAAPVPSKSAAPAVPARAS